MSTRSRKKSTHASPSSLGKNNTSNSNRVHGRSQSMPNNHHASLPHNEHDTHNGKIKRSIPPTTPLLTALHRLHDLFSLATSPSFTLTSIAAIVFSPLLDGDSLQPITLQFAFGYLFVLRPLLSTLSVCLGSSGGSTNKNAHERVIASSFLAAILCKQLPKWASCAIASSAVLAFGLASRQRTPHKHSAEPTDSPAEKNDGPREETRVDSSALSRKWSRLSLKERAALATMAVVASLLLENFLIWVVSATYAPGIHGSPAPLQDNGRIVLESLAIPLFRVSHPSAAKRRLQAIRDGLNVQWGIVAGLGASFVCLELNVGGAASTLSSSSSSGRKVDRSLAGLALRALLTLATARLIRTVSFVLTVLPSQVPDCYRRHFPMPPHSWREWLLVGFLPNSRGGCNDLILSGHATVLTTLGCACTSVADNATFSVAVWTLVAVDYAIEAYQGLHYSVDMWLGCIVTCLLWQLTKGLEGGGEMERKQNDKLAIAQLGLSPAPLDTWVVAIYSLPAFLGFIVLTFVSEAVVNYFLVGYAVWAGAIFAKWGFTNFSQHVLLCLLFVTLGSYL
ncbi:hypothetical protein ACHAW6_007050 [Cyclotella cf. meneghiniana]